MEDTFKFKTFTIRQKDNAIKVNQDGILLGAWIDLESDKSILDIGTGTGVIAIIAAKRNTTAQIDAIDIDELACIEATYNVEQSHSSERINIITKPIQVFAQDSNKRFDHIICNPPFFSGGGLSENSSEGFRQTIKLPHGELLLAVTRLLKDGGKFSIILPFIDSLRFTEMASGYKLSIVNKCEIKKAKDEPIQRVMISFVINDPNSDQTKKITQLIVNDSNGEHTTEYQKLLKDFL